MQKGYKHEKLEVYDAKKKKSKLPWAAAVREGSEADSAQDRSIASLPFVPKRTDHAMICSIKSSLWRAFPWLSPSVTFIRSIAYWMWPTRSLSRLSIVSARSPDSRASVVGRSVGGAPDNPAFATTPLFNPATKKINTRSNGEWKTHRICGAFDANSPLMVRPSCSHRSCRRESIEVSSLMLTFHIPRPRRRCCCCDIDFFFLIKSAVVVGVRGGGRVRVLNAKRTVAQPHVPTYI
jgi:hypothetical protein